MHPFASKASCREWTPSPCFNLWPSPPLWEQRLPLPTFPHCSHLLALPGTSRQFCLRTWVPAAPPALDSLSQTPSRLVLLELSLCSDVTFQWVLPRPWISGGSPHPLSFSRELLTSSPCLQFFLVLTTSWHTMHSLCSLLVGLPS